jgi:chromate transporter
LFAGLLVGLPVLRAALPGDGSVALADAFYRAGALVFGGGHVVLPLLQASVVEPGWVTPDAFLAGYGAAQAMPGPLFTVAGFLGSVAPVGPGGLAGAVIALGAIFLPSLLLVVGTLTAWPQGRPSGAARRALGGATAAVIGLLAGALIGAVLPAAVRGPLDAVVVMIGTALLIVLRVHPIVVVAAAAVAGGLMAPDHPGNPRSIP